MLVAVFWTALVLGVYPYTIYPSFVMLLGAIRNRRVISDPAFVPRVSIVIAAFNEISVIEATLRNKLVQDYPGDRLEVIVVSDGSGDGTDHVVRQMAAVDARVRFIRQDPRQGKTAALNRAAELANGDILIFSDANSIYRADALRALVSNFADASVGYVTGRMLYENPDGSLVGDGCSAFMRFENRLRAAETRIGSVVGVDGGIDAVRGSLYVPMRPDQLPDFVLPLRVVEQGFRVVYEPRAVLSEEALKDDRSEFRMRVRVALRAFWGMWDTRNLMNPLHYPLFSWQLVSHKLLRYVSFLPLAVAAGLNWILLPESAVYKVLAAAQVAFMLLASGAWMGGGSVRDFPIVRYCYYFALLNCASAVAFAGLMSGKKVVVWQPRTG